MQIERKLDIAAYKRLSFLFDDGEFTEINSFTKEKDSLTGVITAYGYVNGELVYAFSQDKTVNSGAVGLAHSAKIAKLYLLAAKTGKPIVGIHDSNGAYVDGTVDSMTAYSEMINASSLISGVVPQISVVAGTCAGSAALLACTADFVVMTKDSEFFMAPPFDSKINGVGTSKAAASNGVASVVCENDEKAISTVKSILRLMPENNLTAVPIYEYENSQTQISDTLESIVSNVADLDSVLELYSDFGKSSFTALATIGGSTVGMAATNKSAERLTSEDCTKMARFMRTCDAFAIPVITFIDTEGFDNDSVSEVAGSIRNMTKLSSTYSEATTVKISVITGKAYGPAFVSLAGKNINTDFSFAFENAVISPLAPLAAVEFLWHDKLKGASDLTSKRNELAEEYSKTVASALSAAEKNCIDEIVNKEDLKSKLIAVLDMLSSKRVTKLPKKHNNIPL